MWRQMLTIGWAQLRTMRNHLPRTSVGAILSGIFTILWYGMYAALAAALADVLPYAPLPKVQQWLPAGLFLVFLFWQLVPLLTLSGGWSLDLGKLQIFPIGNRALFFMELVLGLSTSPEMLLVLLGATAGLLRNPQILSLQPLILLLYIPFNLFLSLAIRNSLRRLFRKNRLRELLGILVIGLSILPAYLFASSFGQYSRSGLLRIADIDAAPWHATAVLSIHGISFAAFSILTAWIVAAYVFARWQFVRTLAFDDEFEGGAPGISSEAARERDKRSSTPRLFEWTGNLLADPLAALVQKEFRSLRRIPRFRVVVGMACLFGLLLGGQILRGNTGEFSREYFLPLVNVYGFLLLGEVLLWNIFGFDRNAAQLYFVAPVNFRSVLRAKNFVGAAFLLLQTVAVLCVAWLFRFPVAVWPVVNEFAVAAVAAVFFLAAGNLTSVTLPKRVNPNQTFRNQASRTAQVWLLLSSACIGVLFGLAYLARYAFDTNWAFLAVAVVEFGIGIIVYRIATESAVEKALRGREHLLETLSRETSALGS